MWLKNAFVFFGIAALVMSYLLYMMVRKRKGERPGSASHEPEL
jgi:hypothetical protein